MTEHVIPLLQGSDSVFAMNRRSGGSDAVEFLRSLQERFRARYQRYLEYLDNGTPIKSPENFRRLSPAGAADAVVFEIKVDMYRLYVVRHDYRWFATHGRDKPKDNQVGREVDKALAIFWEWNGERR